MNPSTRAVLNVGGGAKTIPIPAYFDGWRHDLLDVNANYQPDICLDARLLHTLAPSIYDAVYCSHNLEHFYHHDAAKVLRGFFHVLKDDGFVEIRVPNIHAVLRAMHEQNLDLDDVIYQSPAGPITVHDMIFGYQKDIEHTGHDFYAHKTGFSAGSLGRLLSACGFLNIAVRPLSTLSLVAHAFKRPPTDEQQKALGL